MPRNAAPLLVITAGLITGLLIGQCLADHGPTIKHSAHFDVKHTAQHLHGAIEKKNEHEIMKAICLINNEQRQELAHEFKKQFGTDLIAMLEKALKSKFEELIIALMQTPAVYDASQMSVAMSGMNTDESLLIEILATRTNQQIADLKQAYVQLPTNKKHQLLEQVIKDKTKGAFENLLVSLLSGSRDETGATNTKQAHDDAMHLYREGEGRRGVNAAAFNQVLANRSFAQLRLIFDSYQHEAHHDIKEGIKSEFKGDIEAGFLALIDFAQNSSNYFANLLHKSMKGLGTRDSDLIRLVVTRSEIDLADIKKAYQDLHKKSVEEAIKGDTSGAYRDALLELVTGNH